MNKHDTSAFVGLTPSPATKRTDESPFAILRSIGAAAGRRSVPLCIWVAICLAVAGWYLHATPSSYTAAATIILDPKRATSAGDAGSPITAPALDTAQAESQIQVIRSERLLSTVFDALELANSPELRPGPPGLKARITEAVGRLAGQNRAVRSDENSDVAAAYNNFADRVGARRIGQSYVIEVSYTSGDPTVARKLANAVVSAYLAQQVSFKLAGAQNGAEYLQGRLNALGNEVKAANAGMLAGTVPAALLPDADARVIGAALEPLGRSAPRPALILAFALTSGLLSGLFAVAVAGGLDRRIRTPEQLESETSLPCLGTIPDAGRRKAFAKRTGREAYTLVRQNPGGRFAAAVRDARTSVLLPLGNEQSHAIGLVSWSHGSGRSLIAANLAQVIAMSGFPVTLVDADIHRFKGGLSESVPSVEAGLADILLGANPSTGVGVAFDHNVRLIPARSRDSEGLHEAYLGSPRMRQLIEDCRQTGDVLVDLPALDGSGDARAAAALLDGVILVVESGRTTTDEVTRAVALLSRSGAVVLGAIMNKANA